MPCKAPQPKKVKPPPAEKDRVFVNDEIPDDWRSDKSKLPKA